MGFIDSDTLKSFAPLIIAVVIAFVIFKILFKDSRKENDFTKVILALDKAFDRIKSDLSKSPTFVRPINTDYEIAALLITMADFIADCTENNRERIVTQAYLWAKAKLSDDNISDYINDRLVLYGKVIRGQALRGEWLNGDTSAFENNPITRCLVAFGDIIWNPDCADDYENAPILLHGIFDAVSFSTNNMKRVAHSIRDFCKDISLLSPHKNTAQKAPHKNTRSWIVGILVTLGIFASYNCLSNQINDLRSSALKTTTTVNAPAVTTKRPSATSTPKPVTVYNGTIITVCEYEGTCPFEVKADSNSNFYIYLEYQYAATNSTTARKKKIHASSPYENDIAFYLAKGKSYEIDVPVGVYKLYYATGDTFYGSKLLFGDKTRYYSSDDLLNFYSDSEYYHGHTITLYSVTNGNFDTDQIPENKFPKR